jgi:hypothetical protein
MSVEVVWDLFLLSGIALLGSVVARVVSQVNAPPQWIVQGEQPLHGKPENDSSARLRLLRGSSAGCLRVAGMVARKSRTSFESDDID